MNESNCQISFRDILHNDLGAFWCVSIPPVFFVIELIIFLLADTVSLEDIKYALILLASTSLFCFSVASAWYLIVQWAVTHGVACSGKVLETNIDDKSVVVQMPFAIKYEYEYQGKIMESGNIYRGNSAARDIAVVGKEIIVMRSKIGGFSFIKEIYCKTSQKSGYELRN